MQVLRDRRIQVAGFAGASLTVAALLAFEVQSNASAPALGLRERLNEMQTALPASQTDGSVLEAAEFDGRQLTLHMVADERLDLRLLRDDSRDEKCRIWRHALRAGEVGEVEYRYRQGGAVSSLHLNGSVCD